MLTASTFTPDSRVPFLRNDPEMQSRDAFAETKVLTLNLDFEAMGSCFKGGTKLLVKRIYSPANLVPEAVYILAQQNVPGYEGHLWYNYELMGRLRKALRIKTGQYPSAEMYFSFDNEEVGLKQYGARPDGLHVEFVHFDKPRISKSRVGEEWAKRIQKHRFQLWQVTHYVAPPTLGGIADARYVAEAGITAQQQQWLDEECRIAKGEAVMVTARSNGFDYAPTLEQQLDITRATMIDSLLSGITPISAGRAHRSKNAIVALTRRNCRQTITEFYSQESISTILDLLDGMRREQVAMAALRRQVAEQELKQEASKDLAHFTQVRATALPSSIDMSVSSTRANEAKQAA